MVVVVFDGVLPVLYDGVEYDDLPEELLLLLLLAPAFTSSDCVRMQMQSKIFKRFFIMIQK